MKDFELYFRDVRKLSNFIKVCEALSSHSYTALFKAKQKGIYLMLTDFEGMCIIECRITNIGPENIKLKYKEFTAKILIDSLVEKLRLCVRQKKGALIVGGHNTLKIQMLTPGNLPPAIVNKKQDDYMEVVSSERRPRVYYIMSVREFINSSADYVKFRILNVEFNKLITQQAIMSGTNGGVGKLTVEPHNSTDCTINFSLTNNGGSFSCVTITTHTSSEDVPVLRMPRDKIEVTYLLTYMKRSHNIFNLPNDFVTIYASEKGIILHTDIKGGICTIVYTCNVSQKGYEVDLNSYS